MSHPDSFQSDENRLIRMVATTQKTLCGTLRSQRLCGQIVSSGRERASIERDPQSRFESALICVQCDG